MNQLTNPLQALIDRAAQTNPSEKSTLLARHQQRAAGGPARFILADVSGSMSESAGSTRKIDLLRKALADPAIDWNGQQLVAFSSIPERVSSPALLPEPNGSTALHRALDFIRAEQPNYTLVISDGRPDSEKEALAAADKLTGVIDVLYVGPDSDAQAIAFMHRLAGRTGGRVVVNDIGKQPARLQASIQKLLH